MTIDPPPFDRATAPWYDVASRRELLDNMEGFYAVAREDLTGVERFACAVVLWSCRQALRVLTVCARVVGQ